jgi:hypothetical protein
MSQEDHKFNASFCYLKRPSQQSIGFVMVKIIGQAPVAHIIILATQEAEMRIAV